MKAAPPHRPCAGAALAIPLLAMVLSSCGQDTKSERTTPVGATTSHARSDLREYALLTSKGDFHSPTRVFASRRPGGAIDRIVEIDPVGNGRYSNVQLDCKKSSIAFGPEKIIQQGRLSGKNAADQAMQNDSQMLIMVSCGLDWKDLVRTDETDLRPHLSGYALKRGTPPKRPQIPSSLQSGGPK